MYQPFLLLVIIGDLRPRTSNVDQPVLLRVLFFKNNSIGSRNVSPSEASKQLKKMSSIHLGSMRPLIAADNKSSGSQFFADGHGDQNVALGNGVQYNDRSDRRNITSESGFS